MYQFQALCFSLSMAPKVFPRVFTLVSEWGHLRGVCLLRYLDAWLVVVESRKLLHHQASVFQLCTIVGIVINWEKSDLQPSIHLQYLSMTIDTSRERVCPSQAHLVRFWELVSSFLHLPTPPAWMWQHLHGFSGAVSSEGLHSHAASPVATKGRLVSDGRRPSQSHPLVAGLHRSGALVASGGTVDIRLKVKGH